MSRFNNLKIGHAKTSTYNPGIDAALDNPTQLLEGGGSRYPYPMTPLPVGVGFGSMAVRTLASAMVGKGQVELYGVPKPTAIVQDAVNSYLDKLPPHARAAKVDEFQTLAKTLEAQTIEAPTRILGTQSRIAGKMAKLPSPHF